jgi:hypothetical protein
MFLTVKSFLSVRAVALDGFHGRDRLVLEQQLDAVQPAERIRSAAW